MASSSSTADTTSCTLLLTLLVLIVNTRRSDANTVFAGLSFESPGEAKAFEDALLCHACVNISFLSGGHEACMPRLDTARGGTGSGLVPVLRAALRDTLGEAVGAIGAVRGLASLSNHPHEEMAVRDSVDELGWALDAMVDDTDTGGGGLEMDASGSAARHAEDDLMRDIK